MSSRARPNNAAVEVPPQRPKQVAQPPAPKGAKPSDKPSGASSTSLVSMKIQQARLRKKAAQGRQATVHRQDHRQEAPSAGTGPTRSSQVTHTGHGTGGGGGSDNRAGAPPSTSTTGSGTHKTATKGGPSQTPSGGHAPGGNAPGTSGGSADPKSDEMSQILSIVIFKARPIDASMFRHVGLFIQTFRGTTLVSRNFLDATGSACCFALEESWDRNPLESDRMRGNVQVARIRTTNETVRRLRDIIHDTPMQNTDPSWSCHHWVGDALQRCLNASCISFAQLDNALAGMADVLESAPDQVSM